MILRYANDHVSVHGNDAFLVARSLDQRVVGQRRMRYELPVQQYVPILQPVPRPVPDHLPVIRRYALESDRQLGNREQDAQELQCGRFHVVPGVPHEHVRMDSRVSTEQPQIDSTKTIVRRHVRSVRGPEHISVLPHQRSDVGLPEFDHHLGVHRPQLCHHVGEQPIGRVAHGGEVSPVRDREPG